MTRILMLACVLAGATSAVDAKIYKYVDENGNVVYSQTKPNTAAVQEIRPRVQSVSPEAARKQLEELSEKADNTRKNRDLLRKSEEQQQALAKRNSENCEQARKNLEVLQTSPRVQATDAQGKLFFLDDDAVKKKTAEAQSQIAQFCE